MNDEELEIWRREQAVFRRRLIQARERKGLSQDEAAQLMDINIGPNGYYDLEAYDDELTYCYSVNEITDLCKKFDIRPRDLFCDAVLSPVAIDEVIERIKGHCPEKKVSIEEFENKAGWEVHECLVNPAIALEQWNVDCLVDVCRELGIDWRCVIESL